MFMEPQLYSDTSFLQQRAAEEQISVYKDRLRWKKDELVLDIGCGPGIITSYLAITLPENVSKVIGVDLSSGMVSHASKKHSNPKLSFYRMDITENNPTDLTQFLPNDLKSARFNKVFCFYLFHWLGDKFQQALCNIERLLITGGQGVAIHYVSITCFDTYVDIAKSPKWSTYLAGVKTNYNPMRLCSDPAEFVKNSLIKAGLQPEDISLYSSHLVYHSRSDIVGLLTSIDPFLQYIPKNQHSEYIKDMLTIYLSKCEVSESGSIKMEFTGMNCLFTKT